MSDDQDSGHEASSEDDGMTPPVIGHSRYKLQRHHSNPKHFIPIPSSGKSYKSHSSWHNNSSTYQSGTSSALKKNVRYSPSDILDLQETRCKTPMNSRSSSKSVRNKHDAVHVRNSENYSKSTIPNYARSSNLPRINISDESSSISDSESGCIKNLVASNVQSYLPRTKSLGCVRNVLGVDPKNSSNVHAIPFDGHFDKDPPTPPPRRRNKNLRSCLSYSNLASDSNESLQNWQSNSNLAPAADLSQSPGAIKRSPAIRRLARDVPEVGRQYHTVTYADSCGYYGETHNRPPLPYLTRDGSYQQPETVYYTVNPSDIKHQDWPQLNLHGQPQQQRKQLSAWKNLSKLHVAATDSSSNEDEEYFVAKASGAIPRKRSKSSSRSYHSTRRGSGGNYLNHSTKPSNYGSRSSPRQHNSPITSPSNSPRLFRASSNRNIPSSHSASHVQYHHTVGSSTPPLTPYNHLPLTPWSFSPPTNSFNAPQLRYHSHQPNASQQLLYQPQTSSNLVEGTAPPPSIPVGWIIPQEEFEPTTVSAAFLHRVGGLRKLNKP